MIVPAGDDGVPRGASVMTPGERHAPPGTVTRERDDHKHALTMQYLEDQAVVDDDGYVPPSETASDEDERDARERALTRALDYDDALSRGEGDGAEDDMRLAGMVRAGECVEAIARRKMGGLTTLRWQRVGPAGRRGVDRKRSRRTICVSRRRRGVYFASGKIQRRRFRHRFDAHARGGDVGGQTALRGEAKGNRFARGTAWADERGARIVSSRESSWRRNLTT